YRRGRSPTFASIASRRWKIRSAARSLSKKLPRAPARSLTNHLECKQHPEVARPLRGRGFRHGHRHVQRPEKRCRSAQSDVQAKAWPQTIEAVSAGRGRRGRKPPPRPLGHANQKSRGTDFEE